MPLLLVWVPPPPQVTLQGVHVLQVSQIQSKGFASEIKKTMARLKLVTIMRISQIQLKGLHTAYLDQNNLKFKPFGILASIDIITSVGRLFTETTMSIDTKTLNGLSIRIILSLKDQLCIFFSLS